MKKQTAHKPKDQQVVPDTTTPTLPSNLPTTEPIPKGTKVKSNDGGYIWIV